MTDSEKTLVRLISMHGVALKAVILAMTKQPGVDVKKFTDDIHSALLMHEVSSEEKPDGVSSASSTDYMMLRTSLRQVLPDLPTK